MSNSLEHNFGEESERILNEYARRDREIPRERYSLFSRAALFAYQKRVRAALRAIQRAEMCPLDDRMVLDVGCGRGDWLADFESWGARRCNLAGIDLVPNRGISAQARFSDWKDESGRIVSKGADIRIGDASVLPWNDNNFDIVIQSTVLSSILDAEMKQAVAFEMARVLKPGGIILWYDFFINNPKNPGVRGIRAVEIRSLFPDFTLRLERVTLAPPLARRLVPLSWVGSELLEAIRVLNSHYLSVLTKPTNSPGECVR